MDSFVSMPFGGGPLPVREKHSHDKLAPMPENRRLGYLSVAALIINKMIGTWFDVVPFLTNMLNHRHRHIFNAWLRAYWYWRK